MSAVRYEPWNVLNQLHSQINRIFDNQYDPEAAASSSATADWIPPADIEEYSDRFMLKLDVPGVNVNEINITLEQGVLAIDGKREPEVLTKEVERRRVERPHGRFHRRFTLPETVDTGSVRATGRNGILEVVIPKQPKAQPRRIEVAVG